MVEALTRTEGNGTSPFRHSSTRAGASPSSSV